MGLLRGAREFVTAMRASARLGRASRLRNEGRLEESLREYEAIFALFRTTGVARNNATVFGTAVAGAKSMYRVARQLGVPERARWALQYALRSIESVRSEPADSNSGKDSKYAFEMDAIEIRDALSRLPPEATN